MWHLIQNLCPDFYRSESLGNSTWQSSAILGQLWPRNLAGIRMDKLVNLSNPHSFQASGPHAFPVPRGTVMGCPTSSVHFRTYSSLTAAPPAWRTQRAPLLVTRQETRLLLSPAEQVAVSEVARASVEKSVGNKAMHPLLFRKARW